MRSLICSICGWVAPEADWTLEMKEGVILNGTCPNCKNIEPTEN